jgi:hypothetical protein
METMKKLFTTLLAVVLAMAAVNAQDAKSTESQNDKLEKEVSALKKLKVSGYIQGQWQYGQEAASLKVGTGNENADKGFNRIGIRRGRLKFSYSAGPATAVFQLDINEKEVGIKDLYLNLQDPWIKTFALRAGIFDRPFGYEISYSSSRRESPERSLIFQTLFPQERDLGGMLIIQAPKSSAWHILKLEAGLFAGNGIKQETDNRKDFIGHLSVGKEWKKFSFGAGVSYYNGGVYQGTDNTYIMKGGSFVLDTDTKLGDFAKREYIGVDARVGVNSVIGSTKLTFEYLFGTQPGSEKASKSPNSSSLPTSDTYVRNFGGGYAMLVQSLGKLPVSVLAKYEWYDPNTKVSKDEIGGTAALTSAADISRSTVGVGALWNINKDIRLTAYYDINFNEKSVNLGGYDSDRKDNVFTLRLQYKF